MKKQILTLTLCLVLTATSALANGIDAVAKNSSDKAASPVVKAVVKNTSKTTKSVTPVTCQANAPEVTLTPEQLAKKKFEERLMKGRVDLYCTLGLTSEQRAKAEALDKQQRAEGEPLFTKFNTEKTKYYTMKAKNASTLEMYEQKNEVKLARKAIKAHLKTSREAFEALLTQDQLTKFTELREANKQERKKYERRHKNHDAAASKAVVNPEMSTMPKCHCGLK